jgi:dihydrofolate reductase
MGKLIYSAIASLDGYIEDENGRFDWAKPDEEVHTFANDLARGVGTYLYGRRMYDTMVFWESPPDPNELPPYVQEFASIWQAADKVVFSRTLHGAASARTRIERAFEPETVRELKAAEPRELDVGGPELAAHALCAGLVDELHFVLVPVVVGGGKRSLPEGFRLSLELLDERRFRNGAVYVRYGVLG